MRAVGVNGSTRLSRCAWCWRPSEDFVEILSVMNPNGDLSERFRVQCRTCFMNVIASMTLDRRIRDAVSVSPSGFATGSANVQIGKVISAVREYDGKRRRTDPLGTFLWAVAGGCTDCCIYKNAVERAHEVREGLFVRWADAYGMMDLNKKTFERYRDRHRDETGHAWPRPTDLLAAELRGAP